ncbi:MAG: VanZ family protein [Acidobacteriota bacterium]
MNSVSARVLTVWLLCFVAGTLAPFNFMAAAGLEHGLQLFQYGTLERDPVHFLLNLLLFVPLGFLLHHAGRRRSLALPIVVLAGVAGMVISGTVEYLQAFLPTRDSSLIDVLANTVGSIVGAVVGRRWGVSAESRLVRWRAATSTGMLAGLLGSFLIVALVVSGTLQARSRLSNWDSGYPLLIGNEHTSDRPWRGRVLSLDITDAATPAAIVRRFSAGEVVGLPGAPIGSFVFDGRPPYQDASGTVPDLEWRERSHTPGPVDGWLPARSWLESGSPASGLAQRLRQTNAFTLRVRCATEDTSQDGPARILSSSVSPYLRNFMLGQQGSDLVFRLRTPDTGLNGYPLEVYVPGIFTDRREHEILATYDGATLLVAMAHDNYVSRTELTPGAGLALMFPSLEVRPGELQMWEVAYVGAWSLVPGALIGLLGHSGRQRLAFSLAWVFGFAVLLEATIVGVSGRFFDRADVAEATGIAAGVLIVCNATLSSARLPWRRSIAVRADESRRDALENQPG